MHNELRMSVLDSFYKGPITCCEYYTDRRLVIGKLSWHVRHHKWFQFGAGWLAGWLWKAAGLICRCWMPIRLRSWAKHWCSSIASFTRLSSSCLGRRRRLCEKHGDGRRTRDGLHRRRTHLSSLHQPNHSVMSKVNVSAASSQTWLVAVGTRSGSLCLVTINFSRDHAKSSTQHSVEFIDEASRQETPSSPRKICSVLWSHHAPTDRYFLACGFGLSANGLTRLYELKWQPSGTMSLSLVASLSLPHQKHRWLTSLAIAHISPTAPSHETICLVGCNLHLFSIEQVAISVIIEPVETVRNVTKQGVAISAIFFRHKSSISSHSVLFCCCKDGFYCLFELNGEEKLSSASVKSPPTWTSSSRSCSPTTGTLMTMTLTIEMMSWCNWSNKWWASSTTRKGRAGFFDSPPRTRFTCKATSRSSSAWRPSTQQQTTKTTSCSLLGPVARRASSCGVRASKTSWLENWSSNVPPRCDTRVLHTTKNNGSVRCFLAKLQPLAILLITCIESFCLKCATLATSLILLYSIII